MLEQSRVLVLNQTYEPINVCNARRAIRMMITGKADTIETNGLIVRSEAMEFHLPAVIRLRTYVYVPRRSQIPFSKKNVMRRDENTCQYCGAKGGYLTGGSCGAAFPWRPLHMGECGLQLPEMQCEKRRPHA